MSSCTPAAKKVLDAVMARKGNNRCIDCGSKLSVFLRLGIITMLF